MAPQLSRVVRWKGCGFSEEFVLATARLSDMRVKARSVPN